MFNEPEWAEAENAFLGLDCDLLRDEHSLRFESRQDTRRLNGVRIVDIEGVDEAGWNAELGRHAEVFASRGMPLCVRLAEPLTGDRLPGAWRAMGPRYHHVATSIADFADESKRTLRFEEAATDDQVDMFADMMIVDRIPDSMHEKARPSVRALMRRALEHPGLSMLLAYDGDDLVGQVALIEANGEHCRGYCVSTLSVAKQARGQGYMKALYATIALSWQGWLYGQIIDGKATMAYRGRFPSTRVLATVQGYERVDDPHAGHWGP